MKVARPMGFLRSILFLFLFSLSRVPALFLLATAVINRNLTIPQLILLLSMIFISRSYIESEITGGKLKYFLMFRFIRGVLPLLLLTIVDITLIYYLFADEVTRLLIVSATLLIVILFYDFKISNSYYYGYQTPFGARVVTFILWFYLLIVPDSILGKLSILIAIYIIEYYNLIMNDTMNKYITVKRN